MNHTWCILQKYLNKMTSVIIIYHNCSMSPFLKDHPPQQPVALELAQVSLSSSSMKFSYFFVKSKVPNSKLMDKMMEWNFKTIFKYMGNLRLLLTPIFLLLLVILDISDPPSQYLVNPWNPCAEKQGDDNFSSAFNYWSPNIKETASNDKGCAYWDVQSRRLPVCHCSQGNQIAFLTKLDFELLPLFWFNGRVWFVRILF